MVPVSYLGSRIDHADSAPSPNPVAADSAEPNGRTRGAAAVASGTDQKFAAGAFRGGRRPLVATQSRVDVGPPAEFATGLASLAPGREPVVTAPVAGPA